ncbi:MAG: lignostilbene-alpha,beta-dioxygenase [Symploca sp. SIO3E6]|nr:lignostilbene-alpha,beta-dioxygenase [Caldora sp. SIO3E6]
MNQPTQSTNPEKTANCPPFPPSIMTASREELDIQLEIYERELPEDLQGHVFIVAPVGTVDSEGLPFPDGDFHLNGDGMIYRLDFEPTEPQVSLKTRIVKSPDYLADEQTNSHFWSKLWGFNNHGLMRFSLFLGLRNELNTAFLPVKFSGDKLERLLVTYDAGYPYEIDPDTLEVITPIGEPQEWKAEFSILKQDFRFKPVLTTAHPVFDTYTKEMFTVNYGRSLENFIPQAKLDQLPKLFQWAINCLLKELVGLEDFLYLIRWDGVGAFERWKLINPDGSPVTIKQSMHQIGLTKQHVVLMDTAMTVGLEQLINHPFPQNLNLEIKIRELLKDPPSPDSTLYIVRRDDLQQGQNPAQGGSEVEVVAYKLEIPGEAVHFLVNYEDDQENNNKITVHVAHNCAWDIADWTRNIDTYPNHNQDSSIPAAYQGGSVPSTLWGTLPGEMDIGKLGRYIIDANTLEQENPTVDSKVIYDLTCTWGVGFYTYRELLSSGMTPSTLDNLYYTSFGLWKDLMTEYMCENYENYPYREVSLNEVLAFAAEGKPSCLYRLDTTSMEIADCYTSAPGYILLSCQFVPRNDHNETSTNGYIVCVVFTPECQDTTNNSIPSRSEIWVFDADKLKAGPLCKLYHPQFNIGLSLHTAWLPEIRLQ